MLKILLPALVLFFFFPGGTNAQDCIHCHQFPSVAQYDLDVQVLPPNDADSSSRQWLEWRQLFWLGKHANAYLFNQNKSCIKFIQPSIDDEVKVGETAIMLPGKGDQSEAGNYITTGFVKKSGEKFLLHLDLQTACSRQTVASAEMPFDYSADESYIINIAQQAAAKISPLADQIKKFELNERNKNKRLSINFFNSDPIKITPAKKTLKPGESTDVILELNDCDGTPLEGREIIFTKNNFKGLAIPGTTGGVVSPAKVVTDAQGKAKIKFTLGSNAKHAEINANSMGIDVRGCGDVFAGSALINVNSSYAGHITYTYNMQQPQCSHSIQNENSIVTATSSATQSIQYKGAFVSNDKPGEPGAVISFGDVADEDEFAATLQTGNYTGVRNSGEKHEVHCVCAGNGEVTKTDRSSQSRGNLKTGDVQFTIDENGDLTSISIHLNFATNTTGKVQASFMPAQSNSSTEDMAWEVRLDKNAGSNMQVKKEKRGAKTIYTLDEKTDIGGECPYSYSHHVVLVLDK